MKKNIYFLFLFPFLISNLVYGQTLQVKKKKFFSDTTIFNSTIATDMVKLFRSKSKTGFTIGGTFSTDLDGNAMNNEPVNLEIRGHFRKDFCYIPPLKIIFKKDSTSPLTKLGSLKLVSECRTPEINDQYLLKEYLIYKIYNLLTDLSFRVRLSNVSLVDISEKKKTIEEHAFFLEDIKEVAKRNNCTSWKKRKIDPRETDRKQMTMVAIFEYMIGNTDWGVSANHNTELIIPKSDTIKRPYVVPYDFDFSGMVNTDYSIPDERLGIQSVRERLYRGFPRSLEEINEALEVYRKNKDAIYDMINNFNLLTSRTKKEMKGYLNDFYDLISRPSSVENVFVKNARTE